MAMTQVLFVGGALSLAVATAACRQPGGRAGDVSGARTSAGAAFVAESSNNTTVKKEDSTVNLQKATFGAGCFWGVEARFREIDGVADAAVGYLGGTMANPTYKDVCTGRTGHAEVVQVEYDPARVSYDKLLEVFWSCHNPTTRNRQGPDIGTQYRSAIFFHTPEQEAAAKASKTKLEESGKFRSPIVTEITPASTFYRAEEYHQQYLAKHGRTSCGTSGH